MSRRTRARPPAVRCLACALACWVLLLALPGVAAARGGQDGPLQSSMQGKIVQSGLSGFEPDFDPIDRVVIAANLRDTRPAGVALPDSMLVLSAYLENFQVDTTPVLPDLLHPNQTASGLGGFMTGKAALVNAAGHVGYRGSLLAEVFLDNSVHLVLDLQPSGAPATAAPLRLQGIFTLHKDLSVHGALHSMQPLSRTENALLRVPHHPLPSWQKVVRGLTVRPPKMMGTAGSGHPAPLARPAHPVAPQQSWAVRLAIACAALAAVLLIAAIVLWWRGSKYSRKEPQAQPIK